MIDNYNTLQRSQTDRSDIIAAGTPYPQAINIEDTNQEVAPTKKRKKQCLISSFLLTALIIAGGILCWWLLAPKNCFYEVYQGGYDFQGDCSGCTLNCPGGHPSVSGNNCDIVVNCDPPYCCAQ